MKAGVGGAVGLAAASALAVAGLKPDKGKAKVDYLDIARVPTACFGHTGLDVKVGTRRTEAQCEALLAADAGKAQRGVARCAPGLASRSTIWAASTRMGSTPACRRAGVLGLVNGARLRCRVSGA